MSNSPVDEGHQGRSKDVNLSTTNLKKEIRERVISTSGDM